MRHLLEAPLTVPVQGRNRRRQPWFSVLSSLSARRAVHARKQGRTVNQFPPYQTLAIIWTGPLSFLRTHGPVRNVKRARTASGTRAGRLGALRTFVLGHHDCAFSLANFGQLARIRPISINLRGNYTLVLLLRNPED